MRADKDMKQTIQERSEDYEFSFIADNYAVDFANTISSYLTLSPTDHIANYADLSAWGVEAGLISEDERQELLTEAARKSDEAARIVKRAHRLRDAIYRIFVALEDGEQSSDEDLRVLNRELATALAHVCLKGRIAPNTGGAGRAWGDSWTAFPGPWPERPPISRLRKSRR